MRLLFLTQVLDEGDAVLGFVPRWIEGLARVCERVRVVALEVGEAASLPANVDLRVVGRRGRVRRWLRYRAHLREALREDGFDAVLAHMVPRYALVAAGPARRAGARLYLWYTHKGVDRRLVAAERVVERIFTASSESLRLDTPKRVVTGHGIDLDHFGSETEEAPASPPRLLSVGRMTPAKDPRTVVAALGLLCERGRDLHLDWAGGGLTTVDAGFRSEVERAIEERELRDRVHLWGAVPYREVPALYRSSTVFVSASLTGSVDKVVLEAMAARRPVVTCNEAFPPLFAELGGDAERLLFSAGDARALADRVDALLDLPAEERAALGARLRGIVARDHEVDTLMLRLHEEMGGTLR